MSLFSSFPPVSSKQWKQQIQYELRGADYTDSVVWESPEGIKVRPFYHGDEAQAPITSGGPGEFSICQDIFVFDIEKSKRRAQDSLNRGAESIRFSLDDKTLDLIRLLDGLELTGKRIYFKPSFLSEPFARKINEAVAGKGAESHIITDPVAHLARSGNWFPGGDNFDVLSGISAGLSNAVSADGTLYQNAGANVVQQIAYTLCHANEYLNRMELRKPMVLQIAVGPNYFFEIAKIRALRTLFNTLEREYGTSFGCHIFAVPTKRNKTLYDYNVNMLRTTTECMSAVLGGADTVSNLPYDALYHKSNEFGERIARNQLLILKHESHFGAVSNPADGSHYIEALTAQLAEKALALFKEIEAAGGLLKQLRDGTIQKKIAESAAHEQDLFDLGKEVLLVTNKYPDKADRMANELELFPFVKVKPRKTLITPIIERRLAEKNEIARLESEKAQP